MTTLHETRSVVAAAVEIFKGSDHELQAAAIAERLDGPLRVAIAGKVKAGKSTLLNALVGTKLAPTDEGECTQIVTWYQNGPTYGATAHLINGDSHQLNFQASGDAFEVSLGGLPAEDVERLVVDWPSDALRGSSYIDTPGLGSLTRSISRRSEDFLSSADEDRPVDAVLYLMKHLHGKDIELLRAFHDTEVCYPNPANALGILSRADEIGAGRLDAMDSATRVAARIANEPGVRRLVQTVVPIVGLLAETAATLTEAEYQQLTSISSAPAEAVEAGLLSADRFISGSLGEQLTEQDRHRLLARFAIYGIRISTSLIRNEEVTSASALSRALARLSGLEYLKRLLGTMFSERRDVLKSRSALLALDRLVRESNVANSDHVVRELERIMASAHAFRELRLLNSIRGGWVPAKPAVLDEMERLLGAQGQSPTDRLGISDVTDTEQLRTVAAESLGRWKRRAEHPLTKPELAIAAEVVVRSCEALVGDLSGQAA